MFHHDDLTKEREILNLIENEFNVSIKVIYDFKLYLVNVYITYYEFGKEEKIIYENEKDWLDKLIQRLQKNMTVKSNNLNNVSCIHCGAPIERFKSKCSYCGCDY